MTVDKPLSKTVNITINFLLSEHFYILVIVDKKKLTYMNFYILEEINNIYIYLYISCGVWGKCLGWVGLVWYCYIRILPRFVAKFW